MMMIWTDVNDQLNPHNWSQREKWAIMDLRILLAFNIYVIFIEGSSAFLMLPLSRSSTFSPSALASVTSGIIAAFDIDTETALVTIFLLGYMVGLVLFGTGSDFYGRRSVVLGTMTVYALFRRELY
ncbi:hypothetical protein EDD18DRAFT_403934 [Armillaria luteobubalina]|uniref:Major facilitator superfamily (MFS) profile domain-containing protein n=1 Tax=Armillaria luteobubalina TaxID=153913 RepID=A0AA39Q0T9_9AGAR|nr:hypothetical protein EDD18DRAFT_403934 [Armillaria luteobubalina]